MILSRKLLTRYRELKQEVPDCLLLMQVGTFMQVGAFMQVMDEDARTVSQVTGLKLQMAGEVDDPMVVGGFPRSGLDAYVGQLARAGHSVAVAMQDGDNERRLAEVIRVRCGLPAAGASAPDGAWLNVPLGVGISTGRRCVLTSAANLVLCRSAWTWLVKESEVCAR